MTRVAREFENLLLAVRSSTTINRSSLCKLLEDSIDKTKKCFADQKRIQYWGLAYQALVPALGLVAPFGASALASATNANWPKTLSDALAKTDASTRLQWGSKIGDFMQTWNNTKGLDCQAQQKQIDNAMAELNTVNGAQTTFLQGLETAMQRHQQIQDNAKR